jgi:hypothetical protein
MLMRHAKFAAAIALLVAMSPAIATAQVSGTMTIPQAQANSQCDPSSVKPGTVAGRLGGVSAQAQGARLVIVPESSAAEFFFTALVQAQQGATPSTRLPFNPNDASSVAAYTTQLREMEQQMRTVPLSTSGSFRCGGFAPGRYLVVIHVVNAGQQSFYKSYATVPNPRIHGQRFVVSPTQPQPFSP